MWIEAFRVEGVTINYESPSAANPVLSKSLLERHSRTLSSSDCASEAAGSTSTLHALGSGFTATTVLGLGLAKLRFGSSREVSERADGNDEEEQAQVPMLPTNTARSDSAVDQENATREEGAAPAAARPAAIATSAASPATATSPVQSTVPAAAMLPSTLARSPTRQLTPRTPRTPNSSLREAYDEVLWLRFRDPDLLRNYGSQARCTVEGRQVDDESSFFENEDDEGGDTGAKGKGRSGWIACFSQEKAQRADDAELQPEQGPSSSAAHGFRNKANSGAVNLGEGTALVVSDKNAIELKSDGWSISAWWSYLLLTADYLLLATHYSRLTTYYSLLTTYYLLLTTCYLLLTT